MDKDKLINNLKRLSDQYTRSHPQSTHGITREYYRGHSKAYPNNFTEHWESWEAFKKEVFKERADKDIEIYTLKETNKALQKNNDNLLKRVSNERKLLNEIGKAQILLPKINNKIIKPAGKIKAIMNLSDWHLGEVVKAEEVYGINEYNTDIGIKRADIIFGKFFGYCDKIGISDIVLNFLGDNIGTDIHDETRINADMNMVEALFVLQEYIIKKVEWLSNCFNSIVINFVPGNHGRICVKSGKIFYKQAGILNWEYILAKQVQNTLRGNKKIKICVPKSPFMLSRINGTTFLITHGHFMGGGCGGFAGIPYYGLAQSSAKMYGALSKIGAGKTVFDHIIIGHFHSEASIKIFTGGKLFMNACLCGDNEYSLLRLKSASNTSQLMLLIDSLGGIDGEINIKI